MPLIFGNSEFSFIRYDDKGNQIGELPHTEQVVFIAELMRLLSQIESAAQRRQQLLIQNQRNATHNDHTPTH